MEHRGTARLGRTLFVSVGYGCFMAASPNGAIGILLAQELGAGWHATMLSQIIFFVSMGLTGLGLLFARQYWGATSRQALLRAGCAVFVAGRVVDLLAVYYGTAKTLLLFSSILIGVGGFAFLAVWYGWMLHICVCDSQPRCIATLSLGCLVSIAFGLVATFIESVAALSAACVAFAVASLVCGELVQKRCEQDDAAPAPVSDAPERRYKLSPYAVSMLCSFGMSWALAFSQAANPHADIALLSLLAIPVLVVVALMLFKGKWLERRVGFGSIIRYSIAGMGAVYVVSPLLLRVSPSLVYTLCSAIMVLGSIVLALFSIEICYKTGLGMLEVLSKNFAAFAGFCAATLLLGWYVGGVLDAQVTQELIAMMGGLAMAIVVPALPNPSSDASVLTLSKLPDAENYERRTARVEANLVAKYNLSEREGEVLSLLVQGKTHQEIAQALSLSVWTVGGYVKNVYAKIGVHSAKELIVLTARDA